jgi:asparaginyl-tRNA synthetase
MHAPIVTGSDAEGAGEMFKVTTLPLENPPRNTDGSINYMEDFFGKATNLTVSGQLEAELGALALGNVYTFGPTFRAENSNTPRHLAEFWMIEPEMAFYDIHDNMDLAEEMLKYLISYALQNSKDDLEFLNQMYDKELITRLQSVVDKPFIRLTYTQAVEILIGFNDKFEFKVEWGTDLQKEHENFLVTHHGGPVILTDYPKHIKAFYMKQNEDGKTVRAMDILFPWIGEIIGGSQREENYDKLLSRVTEMGIDEDEIWWYLDTRRFGTCPHAGFGLGFERLMLFVTGMTNIRDVIPFPRTPKNAEF